MSCELPLADALAHVGRADLAKTASNRAEGYTFESRDATLMSFVQALTKNASAETIAACRQHGHFWGISPQLNEIERKLAAYQPEDLADKQFALVAVFNGQTVRKYAAHDRQSTFDAASAFYDDRASYPLSWRKQAAARLIGRSERFATVLPGYVETYLYKAAGLGYPTATTLENAYVQREQLLRGEGAEELTKLGQLIDVLSQRKDLRQDEEFVKEAIDVLADIDTQFGLTEHYGSALGLPEDILADQLMLPALQKQAGAMCRLINGADVNCTKIATDVLNAISPELTKLSHLELAEVLPTLPKPDADLLVRLHKQAAEDGGPDLGDPSGDGDDDYASAELPSEGALNNTQGEMAPTDMAANPPQTETAAEITPSIPDAASATAPMDMPGIPAGAPPTTGTPAVQPAAEPATNANTFTDATADAMEAAPKPDIMASGTPMAAAGGAPSIDTNYAGAGGAATNMNLAALQAGRPQPVTVGR